MPIVKCMMHLDRSPDDPLVSSFTPFISAPSAVSAVNRPLCGDPPRPLGSTVRSRSPLAIDIGQRIHGTDVVEPAAFRSNKKTPRAEPTQGAFLMDTGLVRVPFLYRGCPYRRRFFRR